ncbi:hypothetical protein [Actinoplanes sp. NBRC 101535]|uniref:hypothetical protein n=1 Tax=Actinoplanes sp. NBRC 101535 TaxID=3032196 RepID=UPI0024A4805B|nr:hypothetical protein [Actinoplanes sp. NBRC 101535]GLY07329.1 hypothetical protein Acsp01_77080 [Actinoplanes sp. NBRC 101535]
MDLSSRLEGVAWAGLDHACGDAADLPPLLREIYRAEDPDEIVRELRARLVHQGHVVYSASVEAVPVLVGMVVEAGCPARAAVVRLIGEIAREAGRAAATQEPKIPWLRMWRENLPQVASLLTDGDVGVRRVASSALASAEFDQEQFLERLLEVCSTEQDEPALLGQLTAIADLLQVSLAAVRDSVADRVLSVVSRGSPQVRMAGAFILRGPGDAGVFVEALSAPDVEQWRRTWCVPGRRQSIVLWVDQRLADDRNLRLSLGTGLLASADAATRTVAFKVLIRVAARWRSAMADVAAAGFRALDDPAESVSSRALFVLALSRSRKPEHTNRLAEIAAGDGGHARQTAIWGLARAGDSRCVPHLLSALRSPYFGYPHHQVYEAAVSLPALPSVDELLLEAAPWSDRLLPAIESRLADTPAGLERQTLLRVASAWETAEALPPSAEHRKAEDRSSVPEQPASHALTRTLLDLDKGHPADLMTLKQLTEMRTADLQLIPVLRFLVRTDERVTAPGGGWHSIDLDEKLADAARRLLAATI